MAAKNKKKKKTKVGSILSSIGKAGKAAGRALVGDVKSVAKEAQKAVAAVKAAPANNVRTTATSSKTTPVTSAKASTQKAVSKAVAPRAVSNTINRTVATAKEKAKNAVSNNGALVRAIDTLRNAAGKQGLASATPLDLPSVDTSTISPSGTGSLISQDQFEQQKSAAEIGSALFTSDSTKSTDTSKSMEFPLLPGTTVDDSGVVTSPYSTTSATSTTDPNAPLSLDETNFADAGTEEGSVAAPVSAPVTEQAPAQTTNNQFAPTPTYTFNPVAFSNAQSTADKFKMTLDGIASNPWQYNSNPQESKQTVLNTFSTEFAKSFNTPQEFYNSLQSPELQKTMKPYFDAGGTPAMIAAKIQTPVNDILPAQTTADYLAGISAPNTPAGFAAEQSLLPMKQMEQEEIMRIANIPQNLQDLYFGTEEQTGLLEMELKQAKEEKKLVERKALAEIDNLRQAAQYEIDKNNADAAIVEKEIELQRLQTKNYMTGRLASLGALMTTGAAPVAMGILEQKYQMQKQELQTKLTFANREIEYKLMKEISDKELWRDEKIQEINEDLSKSNAEARKEIFKAQQDAQQDIYTIKARYASELRQETRYFESQLRSAAERYSDNMWKLMSGGMSKAAAAAAIDPVTGTINMNKVPSSVFAPKGEAAGGFTPQELRKLEQAGIDPNKNRKAALDYLYGDTTELGKPKYTGERIDWGGAEIKDGMVLYTGKNKKALQVQSDFEKAGIGSKATIAINNLFDKGYDLPTIAGQLGLSSTQYDTINKHLAK